MFCFDRNILRALKTSHPFSRSTQLPYIHKVHQLTTFCWNKNGTFDMDYYKKLHDELYHHVYFGETLRQIKKVYNTIY